jgi:long-chain acyl-CoA synthetase
MTNSAPGAARAAILAELTAVGPFELVRDESAGYPQRIYRQAPTSLRDVLIASAAHGDRPFLIWGEEVLTFAEHAARAAALARFLRARGVGRGDRVAVGMRNYPEWSVAFWACQAIGAIAVALNAWWTGPELAYALADSTPAALIIDGERLERIQESDHDGRVVVVARRGGAGSGGVDFETAIAADPGPLPDAQVEPSDLATILYTSGTTGFPKGAMATHRNHATNIMNTLLGATVARRLAGLPLEPDPDARQPGALQTFPFFHIGGLTGLLLATATGAKLALMYKWNPAEGVRLVETHGLSSLAGVPIVVRQLLETARQSGARMDSLLAIASGGAPVPPDLIRRIGDQFELRTSPGNGYGLTETTSAVIANNGPDYLARPESVGRPAASVDARVVGEDGADVPVGEIGEIWIRGPNVIPGYWNNPEATEAAFGGGWFRTGDLGCVDEAGLFYVVDRKKDVIIRGGENVYCAEVEAALLEHPAVRDAAIVGLPHADWGEEVAAVIQVAEVHLGEATAEAIRDSLRDRLARFKIPSALRLTTEELPRTATGKVLKRELRAKFFEGA